MKPIRHLADIPLGFGPELRVMVHSAYAAPKLLSRQLGAIAERSGGFELVDALAMAEAPYLDAVKAGRIRLRTFFIGRAARSAYAGGHVALVREPLSQIPSHFGPDGLRIDLLLLQVSPPDESGRMSLGIGCDGVPAALGQDPMVVAQINPDMPRTFGANQIGPEDVDFVLEHREEPLTLAPARGDASDTAIAGHIASLIGSGDVVQTGIGAIPDLTLGHLGHLRDLSVHSGMVSDAVRPLVEAGIVTNAGKPFEPGRSVTTIAAGSADFYRFLDGNAAFAFHPCDVTHGRDVLMSLGRLCAINGALEIDLEGRITAEVVDGRVISAPGGQPDFAAAAAASATGRSIVALRSTSKDRTASRIVPRLPPSALVTIDTGSVDFVVTEHGIARVTGLIGSGLARALVAIADPEFRTDLATAF